MQQKLLAEKDLTFQKAFETAQGLEIAERNSKELQERQPLQKPESVLWMQENLGLLVVAGSGKRLAQQNSVDWASICLMRVSPEQSLHQLLEEYS